MASRESRPLVQRLVSGGQTGVDRAALDVALRLGLDHGGWCPRGRLAEDGVIPARYRLGETRSRQYRVRTERNVMDSDGTLILYRGPLKGGTLLTRRLAVQYGKPCLLVDLGRAASVDDVVAWLVERQIRTLNVAGPRESTAPGIAAAAEAFLLELLGRPGA